MARRLEFTFGGNTFTTVINKVDRTKIYGRVQTETFDANEKSCTLASLARDGRTIIPMGGTATGYVNTEGHWIERGDLVPIDRDGNKINEVPSSFSAPIELEQEVSLEYFLDHPIRLAYHIEADSDHAIDDALLKNLKDGKVYSFHFSYRGGVYHDPAFMMADLNGEIWMLIGHMSDIEFVGFEQAAICAARAHEVGEDDSGERDAFDFDML